MNDSRKRVCLMRGLPGCGKSYTARRLAGTEGIVLETDEYFLTQVGDDPGSYDYSNALLPVARKWNFDRFREAISRGETPVVVDRGNGLNAESQQYAVLAVQQGYQVELSEPDSPWWLELRVLLKYKHNANHTLLDAWAKQLSDSTRDSHRVPAATIRRWMHHWRHDLTVEEILAFEEQVQ